MMWTVTVVQHKVKTNLRWVYDLLDIFNTSWYCDNMQFWHIMLRKIDRQMGYGIWDQL